MKASHILREGARKDTHKEKYFKDEDETMSKDVTDTFPSHILRTLI